MGDISSMQKKNTIEILTRKLKGRNDLLGVSYDERITSN